ncbi:MAG: DUF4440 domain-containing protein [Ottowia sp.]|uniref:nuclear transport factor 2 family protein n=1 Tax=Ottowia sp. TaxID=1898956 RepID=UPI003C771967
MSEDTSIEQTLRDLEESMRRPENRVPEKLSGFLAEEFVEFGSSGRVLTKPQVLAVVQGQAQFPTSTSDFKVRILTPTTALVTYQVDRHGEPPLRTLRSSLWQLSGGVWKLVFHQGTVVP